jgi:hypothetical protein
MVTPFMANFCSFSWAKSGSGEFLVNQLWHSFTTHILVERKSECQVIRMPISSISYKFNNSNPERMPSLGWFYFPSAHLREKKKRFQIPSPVTPPTIVVAACTLTWRAGVEIRKIRRVFHYLDLLAYACILTHSI